MLLRLPNIPLRLNATTGSMATAYEPVDLSKLCTWQVEDGAGALGNATYHLSIFVDEPLACSKVVFDDCTSRPQPCTAMAQSQVQSTVSTERGYEVLHLYSPRWSALNASRPSLRPWSALSAAAWQWTPWLRRLAWCICSRLSLSSRRCGGLLSSRLPCYRAHVDAEVGGG